MKREAFIAGRKQRWIELERIVKATRRRRSRARAESVERLPSLYRRTCQDLALAQRRMYGRELVQRLNRLALDGRERLYRAPATTLRSCAEFVGRDFPRLVREEARLFWLCTALFVVPLAATIALALARPDLLYAVLDPEQMQRFEEMYDPSGTHPGTGRDSGTSLTMFGFYIRNNVSIDFQTFAGGLAGCVGAVLILIFNGIFGGAVAGHLARIGYDTTLYPFVVGHSSFELTAMVIAGVAGMRLGMALLAPGRATRGAAVAAVAPRALRILLGAALMTATAAFIEAFWSPSSAPTSLKYAVGATLWTLIALYLLFAGRDDAA